MWRRIQRALSAVALVLIAAPANSQASSRSAQSVWYWVGDCQSGTMMGVEVLFDGKPVYHSEFRACLMDRTAANLGGQQKAIVFSVSGGRTF
jgi:hypothetical protein